MNIKKGFFFFFFISILFNTNLLAQGVWDDLSEKLWEGLIEIRKNSNEIEYRRRQIELQEQQLKYSQLEYQQRQQQLEYQQRQQQREFELLKSQRKSKANNFEEQYLTKIPVYLSNFAKPAINDELIAWCNEELGLNENGLNFIKSPQKNADIAMILIYGDSSLFFEQQYSDLNRMLEYTENAHDSNDEFVHWLAYWINDDLSVNLLFHDIEKSSR